LSENLDAYISQYTKNDRIKKILEYSTVFLGISPKKAPALFTLMAYVDFKMGVYYPDGGISQIILSLKKLCDMYGVKIKTHQEVKKITVKKDMAIGVQTTKKNFLCDIVVSNADYPFTEMELLPKKNRTYDIEYWKKKTIAPSAFILYLGIKGKVKKLKHHNLFFENDWQEHFNQIFENPSWPDKPSYYVSCPSKTDTTVAPKGCENLFVLIPIAPGLSDTNTMRKKYRDKVIADFESIIGESISNRIMVEKIFSQRDYSELYHAYKGTALGLAHTFFQSAFDRKNGNP
jgi:phytoene desaturase